MFSHRSPDSVNAFIQVHTSKGATLQLSEGHYIWAQQSAAARAQLITAAQLAPGNLVWATSNNLTVTAHPTAVTRISTNFAMGLYNPHTVSGSIVVNGLSTSTFTNTLPPSPRVHSIVTLPAYIAYQLIPSKLIAIKVNNMLLGAYVWLAELHMPMRSSGVQLTAK